ncbi:hypothetical protein [Streptomyces ficellus]|uniref:hypothetical protein n=1 Tax=Streptomyces ficellus TaxID=1977088 RepID=UPI001FCB0FC6|nr:hypothetical protein [Streptomyces ficellus]
MTYAESGARTPGPGAGTLTHSGGPWTSASGTAAALRTSTESSRRALRPAHEGTAAGGTGLTSVAALKTVLTSWEERLAAVRDECDHLTGTLARVAKELGETDTAVAHALGGVPRQGGRPQ